MSTPGTAGPPETTPDQRNHVPMKRIDPKQLDKAFLLRRLPDVLRAR